MLQQAYGGVLFIDEAYYLHRPENERDYGQEAIEILLQAMESERDKLVVILAGYKDRMDDFFNSNPGMQLARRAPHRLPRLHVDELMPIGDLMLEQRATSSPRRGQAFREYLERRRQQPALRARHAASATPSTGRGCARRTGCSSPTARSTRDELMTIEAEDILKSSVFARSDD